MPDLTKRPPLWVFAATLVGIIALAALLPQDYQGSGEVFAEWLYALMLGWEEEYGVPMDTLIAGFSLLVLGSFYFAWWRALDRWSELLYYDKVSAVSHGCVAFTLVLFSIFLLLT